MLAHELAHVRHRDVLVQTSVVVLAASLVELCRIGGWFERSLLFVLGPVAAAFVHLLLSPKREFDGRSRRRAICGSPHGLADALLRLDQAAELVEFQREPGDGAALHRQSVPRGRARRAVRDAPAARERVRRLHELAG